MSFISKLFGRNKPFWENSFTAQELDLFYSEVRKYFAHRGDNFKFQDGYIIVQNNQQKMDLRNLAQVCRENSINQWAKIIETHFQQLEKAGNTVLEKSKANFVDIADLIVVRLWPEGTLENAGAENIVCRKELKGTISTLALDLPDSILAITPEMINRWKKDLEELFSLGYQNVTKRCMPGIDEIVLAGNIKTLFLSANNSYLTATYIFLLENFPKCLGKFGTLVSIPLRDVVVCYPLENNQDIGQVVKVLAYVAQDVYQKGPGSVSPYLYWHYEGKFEIISYIDEKQKITLPDELTELMQPQ